MATPVPLKLTLLDYLGYPLPEVEFPFVDTINSLVLRGYRIIWNEFYRDQNLQPPVAVNLGDADGSVEFPYDSFSAYNVLLPRAKAHDIFTSCLPFPQKFPSPIMALTGGTGLAPVLGLGVATAAAPFTNELNVRETGPEVGEDGVTRTFVAPYHGDQLFVETNNAGTGTAKFPQIYADVSAIDGFGLSISTFREAIAVQSLFETFARGGTRYIEMLKSVWGVTTPDFRLQRPEFLGGGSANVQVEAVAYTAESAEVTAGTLGGAATASGRVKFSVASPEHGFVFIFASIRSELSYQRGLHPMWKRSAPLDYPWPQLGGIGEEVVPMGSIFYGDDASYPEVFGYNERYQWYRTFHSVTTGGMRSQAAMDLDRWHLAQDFGENPPQLNPAFIVENPPMERVLTAGSLSAGQQFLADILISRDATRAIAQYGIPDSLGRRF